MNDEKEAELARLREECARLRGAVWALERQLEALRGPALQTLPPGVVDPPLMPTVPGLPAYGGPPGTPVPSDLRFTTSPGSH